MSHSINLDYGFHVFQGERRGTSQARCGEAPELWINGFLSLLSANVGAQKAKRKDWWQIRIQKEKFDQ